MVQEPLTPPADLPEIQRGNWAALPASDPVVSYLAATHWPNPVAEPAWEASRLSTAAYAYREAMSGWAVTAKFYAYKTGESAERHAIREYENVRRAREAGLANDGIRAIRPLAVWRGTLFIEYVDGLTLEDVVAVRRSRPGSLTSALDDTARLLATLHVEGHRAETAPDFSPSVAYAHKVIGDLEKHGVLHDEPLVSRGLRRLVERWEDRERMHAYTSTLLHGDATTTNFVFPWNDGVVGLDWERVGVGDPASDLGRLMAEVSHSVKQHGGTAAEAQPLVDHLVSAYQRELPPEWNAEALKGRAVFYQATSTLRIARNGWVSRLDRTVLIAQAMALLS